MTDDQQPDRSNRGGRACPSCGGAVIRAHRRGLDRFVGLFRDVRRYRCLDCPWRGLLAASSTPALAAAPAHGAWLAGALVLIPAIALLLAWLGDDGAVEPPPPDIPPAGVRLEAADPRALAGGNTHELRRGCAWPGPTAAPYRGSFQEALAAAGVPRDAATKLEVMRERGLASDRLTLSSTGIQNADRHRHFSLTASALAFGQTVCFTTRMEIPPRETVVADLYEVVDVEDRRFAVMVVPAGGNVAVLEEQPRR